MVTAYVTVNDIRVREHDTFFSFKYLEIAARTKKVAHGNNQIQ